MFGNGIMYLNILDIFPPSFIEEKNLTETELNNAKASFRLIFNKPDDNELDINNKHFGDLIKFIAIANRYPRCKKSIAYLIQEFQRLFQGTYKPAYNLIFIGMWATEDSPSSLDIISYLKFNKQKYDELTEKDKNSCINLKIIIREIFCLTQLFEESIRGGAYPAIQDLYNYLDKLNELFNELFHFKIADVNRGGILEPYTLLRHSIAHSHFVLVDNQIRLVDWEHFKKEDTIKIKTIGRKRVNNILDFNLNEIREEMTMISMIFCQIIALYQLMQQVQ